MSRYRFECKYCGHHWFAEYYPDISPRPKCLKCKDAQIKIKKIGEQGDAFGYEKDAKSHITDYTD